MQNWDFEQEWTIVFKNRGEVFQTVSLQNMSISVVSKVEI